MDSEYACTNEIGLYKSKLCISQIGSSHLVKCFIGTCIWEFENRWIRGMCNWNTTQEYAKRTFRGRHSSDWHAVTAPISACIPDGAVRTLARGTGYHILTILSFSRPWQAISNSYLLVLLNHFSSHSTMYNPSARNVCKPNTCNILSVQ
jgi:hypothetical protein